MFLSMYALQHRDEYPAETLTIIDRAAQNTVGRFPDFTPGTSDVETNEDYFFDICVPSPSRRRFTYRERVALIGYTRPGMQLRLLFVHARSIFNVIYEQGPRNY